MWQALTQNFFLGLEISHSSCPWNDEVRVIVTSIIALPNLLLLHVSISYLFSKNLNENTWHVFEGGFSSEMLQLYPCRLMKEKFHEGQKQNLSKTLVRCELFCAFQVGILQQFLVLIYLGKSILRRYLS